jgi:hypothetical protein
MEERGEEEEREREREKKKKGERKWVGRKKNNWEEEWMEDKAVGGISVEDGEERCGGGRGK